VFLGDDGSCVAVDHNMAGLQDAAYASGDYPAFASIILPARTNTVACCYARLLPLEMTHHN
jgi:hypothetical protein